MPFEQPFEPGVEGELHPGEPETRLNEGEAHEKANMMRAEVFAIPESPRSDHYTAEDYADALAQIEEWEKIANDTPEGMKLVHAAIEHINPLNLGNGLLLAARALDAVLKGKGGRPKTISDHMSLTEAVTENWEKATNSRTAVDERRLIFSSAESKLRDLKRRGERFGKKETQHGTNKK